MRNHNTISFIWSKYSQSKLLLKITIALVVTLPFNAKEVWVSAKNHSPATFILHQINTRRLHFKETNFLDAMAQYTDFIGKKPFNSNENTIEEAKKLLKNLVKQQQSLFEYLQGVKASNKSHHIHKRLKYYKESIKQAIEDIASIVK